MLDTKLNSLNVEDDSERINTIRITDKDTIDVMFVDGERTVTANISLRKIKELIMDEAMKIISQPECCSSSCAVNGFCECDQINEDMEYAGIYLCIGK
jgi:hypothetical protein